MNFAGYTECPVQNVLSISSLFTFFRRKFTSGYAFAGESHDFYEVVCVLDGKAGVTADKNVFVLSAGQMIVHGPGEFHRIWSAHGSEPEIVVFSFRAAEFPPVQCGAYALSPVDAEQIKEVFRAAQQAFLLEDIHVRGVKSGAGAAAVIKRLELFLLSVFAAGAAANGERVGASAANYYHIVSVMERNLDAALSAKELARMCGMSVPAVEKTVARYSGCGAMRYYNELRMKRAAELLGEGKSVKEVALTLGFSHQNYFSLCYKKWAGHAPSRTKTQS